MLQSFRPALVLLAVFTLLLGFAYPLAMTGVANAFLDERAQGSLVTRDGRVVGSALIGQNFTRPEYFWPRPSATSAPDPQDAAKTVDAPYNAASSAGSNLGPLSQKLIARVQDAVGEAKSVPADAVTTSASGLDPHITPQNAYGQASRVARARGLDEARVRAVLDRAVEGRAFGVVGEPRVNVLLLNLALDELR